VQFRYPGDDVDPSEAKIALKQIKEIKKLLSQKFPAHLLASKTDKKNLPQK